MVQGGKYLSGEQDLTATFLYLGGGYTEGWPKLFTEIRGWSVKDHGQKWKWGRLWLGMKKGIKRIKRYKTLPKEAVQSLFLEILKAHLDKAFSNLV